MSIAVVTDSAANVPAWLAEDLGIVVVPMILRIGDREYRDGVDLPPADFYERLTARAEPVSTSGAPVAAFHDAYEHALGKAAGVVCVTVSAAVSMTHGSAVRAAHDFGDRVAVVDSRSASLAEGFAAIEAARIAIAGASLEETADRARAIAMRSALVATVSTFQFLRRSGRVSALQSFAATTLNVNPVFALRDGRIDPLARPLSRRRAIARLVDEVRAGARGPVHLGVVHAAAAEEGDELGGRLSAAVGVAERYLEEFTPLMGAHTGPGLLGVAFWS